MSVHNVHDEPNKDKMQTYYFIRETAADLPNRTLYLTEDIDETSYNDFLFAFRFLEQSEGPIKVVINSSGGDVVRMFSIYDIITTAKNKVIGIGTGEVCSAASLILACCHKRYVTENCVLMYHQHSGGDSGCRYDEKKARREWEDWIHDKMIELFAKNTPKDVSYWKRVLKKEAEFWVLGGERIVEEGVADAVIKSFNDVNVDTST
jgi:ATP-dependent protease ClpP protease subunit